jgi:hypothetical protein
MEFYSTVRFTAICLAFALTVPACGSDYGEDAVKRCTLRHNTYCNRFYACAPVEFAKHFYSLIECQGYADESCASSKLACSENSYEVSDPNCPGEIGAQSCEDFQSYASYVLPPDCGVFCP